MMKILFLVALVSLAFAATPLHCGVVIDGSSSEDIDVQSSLSKISASWPGFEDGWEKNRVLRYEWAVISSSLASNAVKARECRENSGFVGLPDILPWTNAETKTSASASVRLTNGETYYVIVRVTTALGTQKYVNSDGVRVDNTLANVKTSSQSVRDVESRSNAERNVPVTLNEDCPIDQGWRCQAAQVSVREYLEQIYGPPQYAVAKSALAEFFGIPVVAPIVLTENNDDDDDDDDDLSTGDVIGIALGITAFFCLIAIAAILLSTLLSGSGSKFDTNVRRHENVEEF